MVDVGDVARLTGEGEGVFSGKLLDVGHGLEAFGCGGGQGGVALLAPEACDGEARELKDELVRSGVDDEGGAVAEVVLGAGRGR